MRLKPNLIVLVTCLAMPMCATAQADVRAQVAELRSAAMTHTAGSSIEQMKPLARKPEEGRALRAELNRALRAEQSAEGVEAMLSVLVFAHVQSDQPAAEFAATLRNLMMREDRLIQRYALASVRLAPSEAHEVLIPTMVDGLMGASWSDWSERASWLAALQATGDRGRQALASTLAQTEMHPRRREWYQEVLASWPER